MSDENNFAQTIYEKGRQSADRLLIEEIEGIKHVLVPDDCSLKSMAELMPAPQRIKASPSFADVGGFKAYVDEFKVEGSRIFVDEKALSFTTIFDAHAPGKPAWEDHSAKFKLEHAHEWNRFKGFDGKVMSNTEFAEFIEENVSYITGPIIGAELLTMAQNIKTELKGDLIVNDTLQSGMRHLVIKDDSVMTGKSGEKEMEFPEVLQLALRIFKNHTAYSISVYLRYRVTKDYVKFFIKIPDVKKIEEEAFNAVIEDVANATGLPTLKGSYN